MIKYGPKENKMSSSQITLLRTKVKLKNPTAQLTQTFNNKNIETHTKSYVIKGHIIESIIGGHQPPNQREDKLGSQGRIIVKNQFSIDLSHFCSVCDSFCFNLSFQGCIRNALARQK